MSHDSPDAIGEGPGFPRVSGDEPPGMAYTLDSVLFSPRERG